MTMDLSNINLDEMAEEGAILELEHPVTGEKLVADDENKTQMSLSLLGMDSKEYRNKSKELQAKRTMALAKKRSSHGASFVMSDDDACSLLAACTTGFTLYLDGEFVEFSKKAAKELYLKYTWMREQADEFIGDRANFFTTP